MDNPYDLFNKLAAGSKRVSKRNSFSGRNISPSYIDSVGRCPMKSFVDRFSTSSYDAYMRNSLDAEGTAVHSAIEESMNFLIEKKGQNPSADLLNDIITESRKRAEDTLKRHVPVSSSNFTKMHEYVNEVISDYGNKYMNDPDLYIGSEFNVSSKTLPGRQVAGNTDFLMYNAKAKHLDILDFKWASSNKQELSHDFLSSPKSGKAFDILKTSKAQPRVYTHSLLEMFGDQIDTVGFNYDVYWHGTASKRSGREVIKSKVMSNTEANRGILAGGLANDINNVISKERHVALSMTGRNKDSAIRAISRLSRGTCSPGTCNACPMRYQCSFKVFVEDAVESSKGADGQWSIDSELRKLDHLSNSDYTNEMSKQYDEFIETSYNRTYLESRTNLMTSGISEQQAEKIARQTARTFKESLKSYKTTKRGLFTDKLIAGAESAKSPLMFSILDKDNKASWMSHSVRRNIEKYSYTEIDRLANTFEVPVNWAKEVVMDAVYKDRENAMRLNRIMVENTNKTMEKMGFTLKNITNVTKDVEDNVRFALKKYQETIDRNVAVVVQESINKEFLKFVMSIDQEGLRSRLGNIKGMKIDEIVKKAVDLKYVDPSPDRFVKTVARSETFGKMLDRTGSSSRFPLGSLMIAGMLSYIAGVNSVNEIISNKYRKMQFYLNHNEDEIDAGQHASIYTASRRLMYSDFGSPMRWVFRKSQMALDQIKNMTGEVKDFLSIALGSEGTGARWRDLASEAIVKAKNELADSTENLKFMKLNPGLFAVGAAVGFTALGILPHLRTNREVKEETNERRRRFKDMKQFNWNHTSTMEAPESDLRAWYRRWLPIGSPLDLNMAVNFISSSVKNLPLMEYLESGKKVFTNMMRKIQEELVDVWEGSKKRLENVYTKSTLTRTIKEVSDDVSKKTSELSLTRPVDTVKNAVTEGRNIIDSNTRFAKDKALAAKNAMFESNAVKNGEEFVSSLDLKSKLKSSTARIKDKAGEGAGVILGSDVSGITSAKSLLSRSVVPGRASKPKEQTVNVMSHDSSSSDRGPSVFESRGPVGEAQELYIGRKPKRNNRYASTGRENRAKINMPQESHMFPKKGSVVYPYNATPARRTELPENVSFVQPEKNNKTYTPNTRNSSIDHTGLRNLSNVLMHPVKNFHYSTGGNTNLRNIHRACI